MNNLNSPYFYEGKQVPRTTEIISKCIHEESLMKWANYLGFKHESYKNILESSADYGTRTHKGIENYLKNLPIPDNTPINSLNAFKHWWNIITKNTEYKIIKQEYPMSCKYFGGTCDLLIEINKKLYLVDFKTSNTITYKYDLQLAAYLILLSYNNIYPDGTIILQLSKSNDSFKEYLLNFDIPEHKEYMNKNMKCFMILTRQYNLINIIKETRENGIYKQ